MRLKIFIIAVVIVMTSASLPVYADEKTDKIDDLREKIEELTKQAEEYRGNVLEKQQEANTLSRQISILNSQIKSLESKIGATEGRIGLTRIEIVDLEARLYETEKEINRQKLGIAEAMNYIYEHDRSSLVTALIKNPNLSDFMNQAQQLDAWNARLNALLTGLKELKATTESRKQDLEKLENDLEVLSEQQAAQRGSLASNKNYQSKLLKDTKGEEAQYQKLLNETEKQKAAFFAELQALENSAVANGLVITKVKATAVPPRGTKIFTSPYREASRTTQGYGMTSYAKRGAYGGAIHNGWDVVSGCGSSIYAVGAGSVLASGFNSGFGNWVAIEHDAGGGMVSVYGHMASGTHRAIGARVDSNTVIGFEGTTGTSTGCHLHLSLYRDYFTYINPRNGQLYFNYTDGSVNPLDYIK